MKKKDKFYEDIVEEVKKDFLNRQKERKTFEAQWQLNNNFLIGNQYCSINVLNEVEDYDKQYFWQEREVYNHIAPLIEARMAKLTRVKGLGKKTAERIILELKEKISPIEAIGANEKTSQAKISKEGEEAICVLMSLGLSNADATSRVRKCIETGYSTAEEILSHALKG